MILYLVGVGWNVGEKLGTVEGLADLVAVGCVLRIFVGILLCTTVGLKDDSCDGLVLPCKLGLVEGDCEGLEVGTPLSDVGTGVGIGVGRFVGPSLDVKVGI